MPNITLNKSGDGELLDYIRKIKAVHGEFITQSEVVRRALIRYKEAICVECGEDRAQYCSPCVCKKDEQI